MRVTFNGCVFDSETRQILRDGRAASLSPKAFTLLEILIEKRPKAISKEEIRERLWPATFVTEANLANLVVELRAALGDTAGKQKLIGTVPRFGYAFRAEAREIATRTPATPSAAFASRLIWGPREIALDAGENLIGRDREAVVWIDDESVSRRHARIVVDESGATLEDLGSKNGTWVRGKRIDGPVKLADEDLVSIGSASMIFRIFEKPVSTASATDG